MAIITAVTAREMAAKSHAARRLRATQADQRPGPPQPAPQVADESLEKRLARLNKQIDRLFALLEQERDPTRLDRLASALVRVCEQERILSGRPLPGSRRPPAKERKRPMMVLPVPE